MVRRLPFPAYARLFRLSIAFTPLADVVTGCAAFLPEDSPLPPADRLAAAGSASMCLFCFGVALNDYLDRKRDRDLAPDRPIPSGMLTPRAALAAAAVMAAAALGLGALAGPLTLGALALVLLLVLWYNLGARRTDGLGVIVLGMIRSADLLVGASLALADHTPSSWWTGPGSGLPPGFILILYGAYGAVLSTVALGERGQRRFDLRIPALAAALIALVPALAVPARGALPPALVLWLVLALPIYRFFSAEKRAGPERLVGHLVSGFFLLGALVVLGKDRPIVCALLWGGYFLSRALSRAFPPA
jgi:4-hydroxybenzoate polyprenyltransferase